MIRLILVLFLSFMPLLAAESSQILISQPAPQEVRMAMVDSSKAPALSSGTAKKELPSISLAELAQYDGKNGHMAYIAVDGIVYDVSTVAAWKNGQHNGFSAGNDLSKAILGSPHGKSVLGKLVIVGKLKGTSK